MTLLNSLYTKTKKPHELEVMDWFSIGHYDSFLELFQRQRPKPGFRVTNVLERANPVEGIVSFMLSEPVICGSN